MGVGGSRECLVLFAGLRQRIMCADGIDDRFNDRVQDALVWHDGVRIAGEKVGDGVDRVLARIAEAGLEDEGDDAWEGTGGMYHGVI